MKKLLVISVLGMAIMGTAIAEAGYKGHKAKRGAFYDEAEVINVEPITRTVRISVPERECWEEEVYYSDAPIHAADAARNVFIGGIISYTPTHVQHLEVKVQLVVAEGFQFRVGFSG